MVVRLGDLVPVDEHLPLVPGSVVGTNQNACDSDYHIAVRLLQKPAYVAYDFTGLGVAFSRSFMPLGGEQDVIFAVVKPRVISVCAVLGFVPCCPCSLWTLEVKSERS